MALLSSCGIDRGMTRSSTFLAAAAAMLIAAPAAAETDSFYVGLEGGLTAGRDNDVDEMVDPAGAETAIEYDDVLSIGYKTGHDFGIAAGYDFGILRFELEAAHKQASFKAVEPDENYENFIQAVPASSADVFDLPGKLTTISAMANGLIDIGVTDNLTFYGGGGYGRSWVRAFGDHNGAWAWQYIVGVRYKISEKLEAGLKHRYFNSGIVKLKHPTLVCSGNVEVSPEMEGEYRTRSLLVSLHYNL